MLATIVPVLVAALAAQLSYATTPRAAAVLAMYPRENAHRVFVRVNVAGPYATILTRGDRMEGAPVTVPILVERFSFGWQPVESLNFRCRLDAHPISRADKRILMDGMPQPKDDRPCKPAAGDLHDVGAQADVEAIRKQMFGLVPYVVVAGNYAMGEWYGAGGGEHLFQRRGTRWVYVEGGGGAMGTQEMIAHHVPRSAWCKFGIYNAKCHV